MFQACEVKIAKIAAHSTPSEIAGEQGDEAGDRDRQEAEDRDRLEDVEHRHQTLSAARYLVAMAAKMQLKSNEAPSARNMRRVVRKR